MSVLSREFAGNKECPTCRKKLISKRSLRPDPNFDQLVAKMFPYKDDPVSESEERGENTVAAAHQRRLAISKRRVTECEVSEAREEEVDLVLQPHPRLQQEVTERLEGRVTRYVKTVRAARVEHMQQYLQLRLQLDCRLTEPGPVLKIENLRLFLVGVKGEMQELAGKATLGELSPQNQTTIHMYYLFDISESGPARSKD